MAEIQIEEASGNREYWLNRPYLSEQVRGLLDRSSVFLVPQEGFRGQDMQVFPVGTEGFFQHLRDSLPSDASVEIAIDDDQYKELALHSTLLIIGGALVTLYFFPVLVEVTSEYIKQRLLSEDEQNATLVRWEVTVVDGERTRKLTYEGPPNDLSKKLLDAISQSPSDIPINPTHPLIEEATDDAGLS